MEEILAGMLLGSLLSGLMPSLGKGIRRLLRLPARVLVKTTFNVVDGSARISRQLRSGFSVKRNGHRVAGGAFLRRLGPPAGTFSLARLWSSDPQVLTLKREPSLTEQIMALRRRKTTEPQVLDVNRLLRELKKPLRDVFGKDIVLTINPSPHLHRVQSDPGQIEQILVALATNARDAMPDGGEVIIDTENVPLEEEGVAPGLYVMVAMSDTGRGIPRKVLPHIFDPFYTTKKPDRKKGLGLSAVYGIVKQNQGHIAIYSKPGQGTTVEIYFPAHGVDRKGARETK